MPQWRRRRRQLKLRATRKTKRPGAMLRAVCAITVDQLHSFSGPLSCATEVVSSEWLRRRFKVSRIHSLYVAVWLPPETVDSGRVALASQFHREKGDNKRTAARAFPETTGAQAGWAPPTFLFSPHFIVLLHGEFFCKMEDRTAGNRGIG